jgi:hypothetical protein
MLADDVKYPSSVSAITDNKRLGHGLKHAHELCQARLHSSSMPLLEQLMKPSGKR